MEHWTEKKKIEKDEKEKERLFKEYLTPSALDDTSKKAKSGGFSRISLFAGIFLVLAFFVGTGFGFYMINFPSESSHIPLTVVESAFPVNNMANNATNLTQTTEVTTNDQTLPTSSNNSQTPTTTPTTPTNTPTTTPTTPTNTPTTTPTTTQTTTTGNSTG